MTAAQLAGPVRAARLSALAKADDAPPSTAQCEQTLGVPCYTGVQLAHAYNVDTAQRAGLAGAGSTIMVVDPYGNPNAQADLNAYTTAMGLPHNQLQILTFGTIPFPPTGDALNWGMETDLDLQAVDTMAPLAHIILVQTDADETVGTAGFPQIMDAIRSVVARYHVDAASFSFGTSEQNFPDQLGIAGNYSLLTSLRYGLQAAAEQGVSMQAAAGDWGPTGPTWTNANAAYPFRTVIWPSSDPLVTSVGGTALTLNATGDRTGPDVAWSNVPAWGLAGGGGLSNVFGRPAFQNGAGVADVVGTQRGLPDLSMNASCDSMLDVYDSDQPGGASGWVPVCGTSEAAPLLTGLVGDAAALAHHPLGDVSNLIYPLSASPVIENIAGIEPITSGCTTVLGVTGFCAGPKPGYSLAAGNGSVKDAFKFIIALAAASDGITASRISPNLLHCHAFSCAITTD